MTTYDEAMRAGGPLRDWYLRLLDEASHFTTVYVAEYGTVDGLAETWAASDQYRRLYALKPVTAGQEAS